MDISSRGLPMNIFAVHRNPVIAARSLCDAHISKMAHDVAHFLTSACALHDVTSLTYYERRDAQPNHPLSIWCGDNRKNYEWLCWHGLALGIEYKKRYNEKHSSIDAIKQACSVIDQIPEGVQTPFVRAINENLYPQLNDRIEWPNTVLAYRAFYNLDKKNFAKWCGGRKPPAWWNPDFTLEVNINENK